MRRVMHIAAAAVLLAAAVWLATAVDWPLVIAWAEGIWHTLSQSVATAYETLVSLGLIPDAVHPENAAFRLPTPPA